MGEKMRPGGSRGRRTSRALPGQPWGAGGVPPSPRGCLLTCQEPESRRSSGRTARPPADAAVPGASAFFLVRASGRGRRASCRASVQPRWTERGEPSYCISRNGVTGRAGPRAGPAAPRPSSVSWQQQRRERRREAGPGAAAGVRGRGAAVCRRRPGPVSASALAGHRPPCPLLGTRSRGPSARGRVRAEQALGQGRPK